MATKSLCPPFPLSGLGPSELSWFHRHEELWWWLNHWVFWSRKDDELRHHYRPVRWAGNDHDRMTTELIRRVLLQLPILDNCDDGYLVQFWCLVRVGDSRYLTTRDQPFVLTDNCMEELCQYRKHCLECSIAVDETSVERVELGPPGRIFRSGLPESIVDVSHYSSEEYPQRDLAVKYHLKNYSAFPVYRSPGRICIGVLEFVSPEEGEMCIPAEELGELLKEVHLTTTCEDLYMPSYHGTEITKIAKVLKMICTTHRLPVAQTWMEANTRELLTTISQGSCIQPDFAELAYSCSFIWKGHGVVGKAFSTQGACFCSDIRQLNVTECPFVVNARLFRFSSCFAICLQSSCLNRCIYTLEFLLPDKIGDPRTTWLLPMIMEMLKLHLQGSFKIASGQELGQNLFVKVIKVSSDDKLDSFEICHPSSGESTPRAVEVHNQVGIIPPDDSF